MVLDILRRLDTIGGLIPDKPLIQFNEFTQINNGMITMADLVKEATNGTVIEGMINGNSD
jgi:hypothetical protein